MEASVIREMQSKARDVLPAVDDAIAKGWPVSWREGVLYGATLEDNITALENRQAVLRAENTTLERELRDAQDRATAEVARIRRETDEVKAQARAEQAAARDQIVAARAWTALEGAFAALRVEVEKITPSKLGTPGGNKS